MTPTEILRHEHRAIQMALGILHKLCEKLTEPVPDKENVFGHVDGILEFISVFADQCHHGKEETLLFPAMERAGVPREGGPICVMLMEHEMGRNYVQGMRAAWNQVKNGEMSAVHSFVQHAGEYISLLSNHIDKEDNCLFAMAEARLSTSVQRELVQEFEIMEVVKIGKGRHEAFHQLLDSLGKIYLDETAHVV